MLTTTTTKYSDSPVLLQLDQVGQLGLTFLHGSAARHLYEGEKRPMNEGPAYCARLHIFSSNRLVDPEYTKILA